MRTCCATIRSTGASPARSRWRKARSTSARGRSRCSASATRRRLPWADLGIDVALECTGIFTAREKAAAHLEAGARAVLISAPGTDSDLTVVYGVNHQALTREHRIVSNASCTTNCLAPVASVLHDAIGIASGFMTTVHAYTLDQPVLDTLHKDLRRARGAAGSMIPTSTGAARAVGLVLPRSPANSTAPRSGCRPPMSRWSISTS